MAILTGSIPTTAFGSDVPCLRGSTDKGPLSYVAGEEMVFTLTAGELGGELPAFGHGLAIRWKIADDFGRVEEGDVPFDGASAVLRTSLDRPGFVRVHAHLCAEDGKPVGQPFDGGAAVRPEELEPPTEPPDFDAFWTRQFTRLDLVPIKAGRIETDSPDPEVRRWAVRVDCAGLRPVTDYLSVPKAVDDGDRFPARLKTQSYNGNDFSPNKPAGVSREEIVFDINAHGLKLPEFGATETDRKALRWEARSNGRMYAHDRRQNEDPETAYFNGMVLRVKRALQFLKTVEGWNGTDLAASGRSQGGLQAIWAGGCGEGVTEVSADRPWCCDLPMNEVRNGWEAAPGRRRYLEWTEALGYYDAVSFARRFPPSCRVEIPCAGLGDDVCPPMGVAKLWNALDVAEKRIVWMQGVGHKGKLPPDEGRDTVWERRK